MYSKQEEERVGEEGGAGGGLVSLKEIEDLWFFSDIMREEIQ